MTLGNLLNFPQFHHIEKAHGVLWKLNGEQVIRVQKCKVSDSNYSVHVTDDHDDNFFFLSEKRERNCAQKFQIRDPFGQENTLLIKERLC